jgi:hypothetical protein
MPELRRNRARLARNQQQQKQTDPPVARNYVKTRAAVAREAKKRPRTRLEAKRLKEKEEEGDNSNRNRNSNSNRRVEEEEEGKRVILISESDKKGKNLLVDIEEEEKVEKLKGPMADDSGGLSANKAGGQEEEGNNAPFPDKVCLFCFCFCFFNHFLANLMPCHLGLLYFVVILLIYGFWVKFWSFRFKMGCFCVKMWFMEGFCCCCCKLVK